jgi:hypothetical protein
LASLMKRWAPAISADELGRGQGPVPGLGEQVRRDPGDEVRDLGLERVDGDGQLAQAAPDARSARERLDAALGDVTAAYGACMQRQSRLNGYCDSWRHRRDDPALAGASRSANWSIAWRVKLTGCRH